MINKDKELERKYRLIKSIYVEITPRHVRLRFGKLRRDKLARQAVHGG